jgi:hypothetical protein
MIATTLLKQTTIPPCGHTKANSIIVKFKDFWEPKMGANLVFDVNRDRNFTS